MDRLGSTGIQHPVTPKSGQALLRRYKVLQHGLTQKVGR